MWLRKKLHIQVVIHLKNRNPVASHTTNFPQFRSNQSQSWRVQKHSWTVFRVVSTSTLLPPPPPLVLRKTKLKIHPVSPTSHKRTAETRKIFCHGNIPSSRGGGRKEKTIPSPRQEVTFQSSVLRNLTSRLLEENHLWVNHPTLQIVVSLIQMVQIRLVQQFHFEKCI